MTRPMKQRHKEQCPLCGDVAVLTAAPIGLDSRSGRWHLIRESEPWSRVCVECEANLFLVVGHWAQERAGVPV